MNQSTKDVDELRNELESIIAQEIDKLNKYREDLFSVQELSSDNKIDSYVLEQALKVNLELIEQLTTFRAFIYRNDLDESVFFNETTKVAGYLFKNSISSRTNLTRHTPTLSGVPITLDPQQNSLLNPGTHTVDYGRGGYFLYPSPESTPPIKFTDSPVLSDIANSITNKLYGYPCLKSLFFTCGLGAMNTFFDYVRSESAKGGKKNVLGERCWIEVKKYVTENYSDSFMFIDEKNTSSILDAIQDSSILSIGLETIINHPELPIVELDKIMEKVRSTEFREQKIIFIDTVHTPEFNLYKRYFPNGPQKNLCLASVVSGVKFSQAGWDISKSGLLILRYNDSDFSNTLSPYEKIIQIRGGSGRVLSLEEAHLANLETEESFKSRMKRYDRNVKYLAETLNGYLKKTNLGYVSSPWLTSHKDHNVALSTYNTGGRLIYLFLNPERIPSSDLPTLYRNLAKKAESENTYLMVSSSFGMASPHVHLVMHPQSGPTIRISPGSTNMETVQKLKSACISCFDEYLVSAGGLK